MYAVTYEAEELNLLPEIPHSTLGFFGRLELAGTPSGSWRVEGILVAATNFGVRPIVTSYEPIAPEHPLFGMIVAAAAAYDKATGMIGVFVKEQLEHTDSRAASDFARRERQAA